MNEWAKIIHAWQVKTENERHGTEAFLDCYYYMAMAVNDIQDKNRPLYCEYLKFNPCPECRMASGECTSFSQYSKPMGAAADAARVIIYMLGYLYEVGVNIEGLLDAIMGYGVREHNTKMMEDKE